MIDVLSLAVQALVIIASVGAHVYVAYYLAGPRIVRIMRRWIVSDQGKQAVIELLNEVLTGNDALTEEMLSDLSGKIVKRVVEWSKSEEGVQMYAGVVRGLAAGVERAIKDAIAEVVRGVGVQPGQRMGVGDAIQAILPHVVTKIAKRFK